MTTPQNQATNRKKWIAALRSGAYAQTKGRLRNADGFCCLGVACDLLMPEAWAPGETEDGQVKWWYHAPSPEATSYISLPEPVREMLGLAGSVGNAAKPLVDDSSVIFSLIGANDAGLSFFEIAQILEDHEQDLVVSAEGPSE